MSWKCPKCSEDIEEDEVVNCWNCGYDKITETVNTAQEELTSDGMKYVDGNKSPRNTSIFGRISLWTFVVSLALLLFGIAAKIPEMLVVGVFGYVGSFFLAIISKFLPPKTKNNLHANIVISCVVVLFILKIFVSLNRV